MTTCVSDFCRLDRRKRAIVDAARTLFIEQGYERTTVGDIVEKAGGSLSTVYKVFGSKDGLLEAVVFEKAGSGEAIINRTMSQGGSPAAVSMKSVFSPPRAHMESSPRSKSCGRTSSTRKWSHWCVS